MSDWLAPPHSGLGEKHRQPHPHAFAFDDLAVRLPLTEDGPSHEIADPRVELRLRGVDFVAKHLLHCGPGNISAGARVSDGATNLIVRDPEGAHRLHGVSLLVGWDELWASAAPFFSSHESSFSNGYKNLPIFIRPLRSKGAPTADFARRVAIKSAAKFDPGAILFVAEVHFVIPSGFANRPMPAPKIRISIP
jgi:hypothetical protein